MKGFYPPIKLPPMSYFSRGTNKETCPYDKLYIWSSKKIKISSIENLLFKDSVDSKDKLALLRKMNFTVSDFWLSEDDYKKLEAQTLKWYKKFYKSYGGKKKLEYDIGMINLDRAPCSFSFVNDSDFKNAKPRHLYVRIPARRV